MSIELEQGLEDLDINADCDLSHRYLEDEERFFSETIGCIEDILVNSNFLKLHTQFMEQHWQEFSDDEENKLVYTDIFRKYQETVEKYIVDELHKRIANFDMFRFERELRSREHKLEGEIFEVLTTFTDFLSFKDKFIDYKAMKEGTTVDPSKDLSVMRCETRAI